MPSFGRLFVSIGADISGLQKALNGAETDLKKASRNLGKLGADFTTLGSKLTVGLTAPILGAATAAFKFSKDFNEAMASVATLIPGNAARVNELKTSVQDLGVQTGKSTDDIARGLFQVISAFGDSADSVQQVEIAARAATAGLATTEDSINLISAVTKGYGDVNATASAKVADLAFKTNELGQTTFPELASSMGRVIPLAANLKVSQEELFATFAALTGVTGNTAEVSTQLASAFRSVVNPSKEMQAAIEQTGFATGSALVEAQGFQGALKALVGTTDGSAESIIKMTGRAEAMQAVLALTSSQSEKFESSLEAMKNAAGATDKAFAEITGGVNKAGFEFEQLKIRAEVIAQRFGDSLKPAFDAFLTVADKVVGAIEFAVETFGKLPEPIKVSAIALAGIAAAVGPALIAIGTLASSVAGLIPLFAAGGPLAGAFAGFGGILAAVTGPVGIAVAVIAGLGVAIFAFRDDIANSRIGEIWSETWERVSASLSQAFDGLTTALSNFTAAFVARWEEGLFGLRPVIEGVWNGIGSIFAGALETISAIVSGGLEIIAGTINVFAQLLSGNFEGAWEAAKGVFRAALGTIVEIVGAQVGAILGIIDGFSSAIGKSLKLQETFDKEVDGVLKALDRQSTGMKGAEKSIKKLGGEVEKTGDVVGNLPKKFNLAEKAVKSFDKQIDEAIKNLEKQAKQEKIAAVAAQEYAVKHDDARRGVERLRFDIEKTTREIEESTRAQQGLARAISSEVVPSFDRATQASIGLVVAATNTQTTIAGTEQGFHSLAEAIAGFGIKSQSVARGELEVLRQQLEVIRKQAAEGNPEALAALSEAQRKYDEAVKASIGGTNEWGEALKQVSTIITDFAKNVSQKFISVLTGGDRRAFNRALEEQAEELRQKLDEATSDLEMSLADRESAYRDYVMEVADAEQEIRDNSARRLSKELEDLQDSLAKKTESYQRFVEDVNTTLARKRSDFTDDIADEKKKTAQTIAERRKRNARDIADAKKTLDRKTRDIEAQIREELAKGEKADHDRIAALRRRLADEQEDFRIMQQRKLEDLHAFIAQEQAALAEFEEEKRQKLARETEDIQKDLERREHDYAAYVDEINAKAAQITEKIRTEEQAKLAALQESLAKQTAEYEKFKTDTLAKYEETKTGINAKLDELAEKHRSVTDDIKGLFSTAFSEAGVAITRFVTETLVGKLFKELGKLTTEILPGVGKALKAIFGGGGASVAVDVGGAVASGAGAAGQAAGAAGEVVGAAGGAGSAAGTAASTTLGTFASVTGIVTGIVSAISGVISNFQLARQETTLNAIELNTRKTSRVLEGDRGPGDLGIIGALFAISDILQFGTFVKVLEQIRDKVSGGLSATGGGTPDMGFLVGNTDEMKTTLWDIRSLLRGGVTVAGMAAIMTGTAATAAHTAATAQKTALTAEHTATLPERIARQRIPVDIGIPTQPDVPQFEGSDPRFPFAQPESADSGIEELRRRNPLAFGSDNPLASLLLGGRDPQSFGADIGAGIDLSGLQAEFEAAQQTATNQLDELHRQTAQLEAIQDAIEAQEPSIVINIQNVNGTDQRAVEAFMKEVEKRLRTSTRGIR